MEGADISAVDSTGPCGSQNGGTQVCAVPYAIARSSPIISHGGGAKPSHAQSQML